MSGLDPLFSLYHSGRIIFFTLEASKRTMYQAMKNKQIYVQRMIEIKDIHRMNYFEGIPFISYYKQITLSISISSSWNCNLQKALSFFSK